MIVRTFTHAWNMRVRIYAFDDIRLPVKNGISIPQVLAGLAAALVWVPLCLLLGVPSWVGNAGVATMIIAVPPVLVLLYSDRPITHEKTVEEWLSSWLTHQAEPRRLAALTGAPANRRVLLTASRWVPEDQLDGDRR
jgi:hypothetical protein